MVLIEPRDTFAAATPAAMVTHRLVLRPPRPSDLDILTALYADPAVTRFCAAATPNGRAATETQLAGWLAHWQAHGFGHWAIAERDRPDGLIGFGGLMQRSVAGHAGLYLYYRISPQAWGRGLASEMALHAFEQAFGQRRVPAVCAAVLPS
ncbi:MAG: N-acetyltransferase, partial [Rubrivivax sp.]